MPTLIKDSYTGLLKPRVGYFTRSSRLSQSVHYLCPPSSVCTPGVKQPPCLHASRHPPQRQPRRRGPTSRKPWTPLDGGTWMPPALSPSPPPPSSHFSVHHVLSKVHPCPAACLLRLVIGPLHLVSSRAPVVSSHGALTNLAFAVNLHDSPHQHPM
jgi:hypothetical protein